MRKLYADNFQNRASIEEYSVLPYAGAIYRTQAFRLKVWSVYDADFVYHVSVHETEMDALCKLHELSGNTWEELVSLPESGAYTPEQERYLHILDRVDMLRRNHYYDRMNDNDSMLRLACGIIAHEVGFESRAVWVDILKKDPATLYAQDWKDADIDRERTF